MHSAVGEGAGVEDKEVLGGFGVGGLCGWKCFTGSYGCMNSSQNFNPMMWMFMVITFCVFSGMEA